MNRQQRYAFTRKQLTELVADARAASARREPKWTERQRQALRLLKHARAAWVALGALETAIEGLGQSARERRAVCALVRQDEAPSRVALMKLHDDMRRWTAALSTIVAPHFPEQDEEEVPNGGGRK